MLPQPSTVHAPVGRTPGQSRRRFLALLALGAVAGAGIVITRRTALLRWLVGAPAGQERVGRIGDGAALTLDAVVAALLDGQVERSHYADFFRWRAANMAGMRSLYERFARRLDAAARAAGHRSYRAAPRETQRRLLAPFLPSRGRERVRRALFAREDERFARHVVREVFVVFSRTDAWLRQGYSAWPGMPRAVASLAVRGPRA